MAKRNFYFHVLNMHKNSIKVHNDQILTNNQDIAATVQQISQQYCTLQKYLGDCLSDCVKFSKATAPPPPQGSLFGQFIYNVFSNSL